MEYWWNDTDWRKPKRQKEELAHSYCVLHTSYMDRTRINWAIAVGGRQLTFRAKTCVWSVDTLTLKAQCLLCAPHYVTFRNSEFCPKTVGIPTRFDKICCLHLQDWKGLFHVETGVIRVENEVTLEVTFTPSICPVVESLEGLHSSLSRVQPKI